MIREELLEPINYAKYELCLDDVTDEDSLICMLDEVIKAIEEL